MMRRLFAILSLTLLVASSCNIDEEYAEGGVPTIELDIPSGCYAAKVGNELTIAPRYGNTDASTTYAWSHDGVRVASTPTYSFTPEKAERQYLTLEVTNQYGRAKRDIRVDIVERDVAKISLAGANEGFTTAIDEVLPLRPYVEECALPISYSWCIDEREVATTRDYDFCTSQEGKYRLSLSATTEDGTTRIAFDVTVCKAEDMPFEWYFEQKEYNMSAGRTILLRPLNAREEEKTTYTWSVDGCVAQQSGKCSFEFSSTKQGTHTVSVTSAREQISRTQHLTINVCATEGTYFRASTAASSASWATVYELQAAPGQFINEDFVASTAEEACRMADERMRKGAYISLGGFGGYMVMGFDHSITASGGYDIAIRGNAFDTSSEPAIVYVMQDENGDGAPNDTWYELAGSETGKAETIRDYEVTYYRPTASAMAVEWRDNRGGSGTIDYLPSKHDQPSYYPQWLDVTHYTLRGTRLEARNYDSTGNGATWILPPYDWGYADNFSSIDGATNDGTNRFRIVDAIDHNGASVKLAYIDFVKVQTACHSSSGWLGESSSEVCGAYDCSMME